VASQLVRKSESPSGAALCAQAGATIAVANNGAHFNIVLPRIFVSAGLARKFHPQALGVPVR
jgi:hypothetical protein